VTSIPAPLGQCESIFAILSDDLTSCNEDREKRPVTTAFLAAADELAKDPSGLSALDGLNKGPCPASTIHLGLQLTDRCPVMESAEDGAVRPCAHVQRCSSRVGHRAAPLRQSWPHASCNHDGRDRERYAHVRTPSVSLHEC
jgi:hypothetical protein